MIAAAWAAIGIGQAADAATVKDYDLYLRYEGTSFYNFVFYDKWNNYDDTYGNYYPAEDPLGLKVPNKNFPGLAVGDIVRFIATIIFPDNPNQLIGQYDNGGRAPVCLVGKTSCTNTEHAVMRGSHDGFRIDYSDLISIAGSKQVGSEFVYSHFYPGNWSSDDGRWDYYAWYTDAYFTVVRIDDALAPVPLPATAALLPLGLGAMALMRRRRRRVSRPSAPACRA